MPKPPHEPALAIIKQRPGITPRRLATALNLSKDAVTRLISELEKTGEVRQERDRFAVQGAPPKLYHKSYQPSKQPLFQPVKDAARFQCKTYIDPSFVGTYQPAQPKRSYIADLPTDAPWKSNYSVTQQPLPEEPMKRSRTPEQVTAAVEDALTELLAAGKPFNKKEVERKANLGGSTLYKRRDLMEKVEAAIASIRPMNALEAHLQKHQPKPVVVAAMPEPAAIPAEPPEVKALKQQVAELEQRNRELRAQLGTAQPQINPEEIFLQSLKADEQKWKETLKRIEAELVHLEADKKGAIANLYACQKLISSRTGEEIKLELEMHYSTNSNGNGNGNGNGLIERRGVA